jgi:hypothetical protein
MPTTKLSELVPVLQVAVGPVILISGVGLLLLSLTNRFGRAIDRSRQIIDHMQGGLGERERLSSQVHLIYKRAKLLRTAIVLSAVSVLLAAIMIITLFIMAWLKLELGFLISLLFIGCLTCLICSLAAFILEVRVSLSALRIELGIGPDKD